MSSSISTNSEILKSLSEFEESIDNYRASLNTEGVWLFLATLGCWSVNGFWYQLLAVFITFYLFTNRIYVRSSDKRLFPTIIKDLERRINTELEEGDTRKARLHDLQQIRKNKLSIFNHIKSTFIFLICYAFLGATLWHCYKLIGHD